MKITLLNCLRAFTLVFLLIVSQVVTAAESFIEQTSTGWLLDFAHPAISVQLQLSGEKDQQLKSVNALLQVEMQDGWKVYWRAPGEGGAAPVFDFSQSENIKEVAWRWPAPKRYTILGVDTLGYKESVNFPLTVYLQEPEKPALLQGELTLASCSTYCVISSYNISLQFISERLMIEPDLAFSYQQALASVPLKVKEEGLIKLSSSSWDQEKKILSVELENKAGWHQPDIFVDPQTLDRDKLSFSAPQSRITGNKLLAEIQVSSMDEAIDLQNIPLNLTIVDNDIAMELISFPGKKRPETLLSIFIIALIGGLILNIMPCVLPVLGMKLSTILLAKGIARRQIRRQFLASSAGILGSFYLLALFLLILKLNGQALGWGIQFQSPYFLGFMFIIMVFFAASMLDLFTIQLPVKMQTWLAIKGGHSYFGHFIQGMFATLLATPCSAPFLGTAVAFSLAASGLQLFIIFTALGLGMAFPWLLIALFPVIAQYIPKPGRWMNSVKIFFALLILATGFWLLSLLSSFIGQSGAVLTALLLTFLLLFFIVRQRDKKSFFTVLSVLLLSGLFSYFMLNKQNIKAQLHWQPLDTSVIEQQVKQGKIVFVDITADWCITCKANKFAVLHQEPVYSRLQTEDITLMQGDWTHASASVSQFLQSYGRVAVPFNIVYGPEVPQGIPLPTILTAEQVLTAIKQAKGQQGF